MNPRLNCQKDSEAKQDDTHAMSRAPQMRLVLLPPFQWGPVWNKEVATFF